MILKIFILLVLLIFSFTSSVFACTSFALYGNQIFYGMNFDYISIPLKFLIESNAGMNIFHTAFLFEKTVNKPEFKNYFAKTCGINDKGLFCASQEIEPYIEGTEKVNDDEIHIDDQYKTISTYSNVEDVQRFIEKKRSVQDIGPSIHNLFADMNGTAIVSETDNKENHITKIRNNFMIMANFANHSLIGKSYREATGAGADKYIIAHEYISKNIDFFSVDKGFDLLKMVVYQDLDCSTLCSMIFHPQTNNIYIVMNQNFEKIWKISLNRGIIETYRGHGKQFQTRLGPEGILSTDLEKT